MPGALFLEGEEIELRTLEEDDLEPLRDIYNHPEVLPNLTWDKPRNVHEKRQKLLEEPSGDKRIDLTVTRGEEVLGQILLVEKDQGVAEIGIWLHPDHQNKGYGTEATELLIEYGFNQLRYHKMFARVYEENRPSQKMFENLGFRREGELREQIYRKGRFEDAYLYGLLKDEWRNN